MQRAPSWIAVAVAVVVAACAPTGVMDPAAVQRTSQVESTLKVAEQEGAARDPRASRHLALARTQLADARRLSAGGDHDAAKRRLDQATLDARLALAMARETRARSDVDALQARIDALKTPGTPPAPDTQEVTP